MPHVIFSSVLIDAIKTKLKLKMHSVENKSTAPPTSQLKLPKVSKEVFKWQFELANFQILKPVLSLQYFTKHLYSGKHETVDFMQSGALQY